MALHWLTALATLVGVTAVFAADLVDTRQIQQSLMTIHRTAGLVALCLFFAWMLARHFLGRPRADSRNWTDWTDWAEQGAHTLMYVLLFLLPILGWALSNARGQDVWLLGLRLPKLIQERNPDFAYTLQDFHSTAAWILIAVVALHVASVAWHHFVRHDDVLRSMLPTQMMDDDT